MRLQHIGTFQQNKTGRDGNSNHKCLMIHSLETLYTYTTTDGVTSRAVGELTLEWLYIMLTILGGFHQLDTGYEIDNGLVFIR